MPKLELLWWEGCPSWTRALANLRDAAARVGIDPETIEVTEVTSEGDAERERFVGSPTIRVDGKDLFPPADEEPIGLTCRIYTLRDGRVSPTPDPSEPLLACSASIG